MQEQFYDLIHQDKKYDDEVSLFLKKIDYRAHKEKKIFEIGSGTGNHTIILAKHFEKIYAIEKDPGMILKLKQKMKGLDLKNVTIIEKDFLEIDSSTISTSFFGAAFFNVVNYLIENKDLRSFFKKVYSLLKPGGLFVFDAWKENRSFDPNFRKESIFQEHSIILKDTAVYSHDTGILRLERVYEDTVRSTKHSENQLYKLWKLKDFKESAVSAGLRWIDLEEKPNQKELWIKVGRV